MSAATDRWPTARATRSPRAPRCGSSWRRVAALALLLGTAATTLAQSTQPSTTQSTTTRKASRKKPPSTSAASTKAAESEPDRYLAVINGLVHTMTGPRLDGATVLCKNGKIIAIGSGVQIPQDCEVVDAHGKYVYPGLVAVLASGIHAGRHTADTTDVYGLSMELALAGGITTSYISNQAAKLTFGSVDDLILRKDLFVELNYSFHRPLDHAETRAEFEKVRNYLRELKAHELAKATDENAKPPEKDWLRGKYETYRRLMTGEAVAIASADRVAELLDLAELSREFGFKLVIRGAFEGWIVADELARSNVSAIVTPRTTVPRDEQFNRPNGSTIENARILHEHGVRVAIIPATTGITLWGLAGRDLLHLNMEAAFAVRGGMSNDDAIRAITIDAARILGVDDRVGSLEAGKDADIVICDGDLLNFMTQVHYTIVNGRVVYDKSENTLFAHIRPEGKPTETKFSDIWPRRLEWPEEE